MMNDRKYKLAAPDVDGLLRFFDRRMMNPVTSTEKLLEAFEKVYSLLEPLAPHKKNNEAKSIWIRIPRGTIEDYGNCNYTFEEAKDDGDVETYEEYVENWQREYPDELSWYELVVVKSFDRDGTFSYYGMSLGHETVISASLEERVYGNSYDYYEEDAAVKLCELIIPAVKESIDLLINGNYNDLVESSLPYQFRVGVIKHSDLREYDPEDKERDYDGLSEETVRKFKQIIDAGMNDENRIGRIRNFTANDFFKACEIGYRAIGKDCNRYSLPDLYMHYADGRDEGLTGKGHGLNAGPGIDFDDPQAWDEWYNSSRGGGHPWEVVPGGNSTHMELFVRSDKQRLDYLLRAREITQEEYDARIQNSGYYFQIVGMQRQFESVTFYVALTDAGFPVIISGADELISRFDGTDYIGIVPHHLPTRYCESLFPDKYGVIIDFTHVYKDEDLWFEKIEWIPEEPAALINEQKENRSQ